MSYKRLLVAALILALLYMLPSARAGDLKIPLPKKSRPTPVQKLNRQGVDAIRSHNYEKAKALFYQAYLYDPDDPFTLNNLGYVSEMEGKLENAQRFYQLAAERATNAVVDKASSRKMEGKLVSDAVTGARDIPMRINRGNVEALRLLAQRRAPEADALLERTLSVGPRDAFTLNNLGVAKEMQGDYEEALKYYQQAAASSAKSPAVITLDRSWRGKPLNELAAANAKRMRERLEKEDSASEKAARLSLRGVTAMNRNDVAHASQYFRSAYAMDPTDAFALNNMGYLAEMNGDMEAAQDFYQEARAAHHADERIGIATKRDADGKKLGDVAVNNNVIVTTQLASERNVKRRERGPIQLYGRDNKPIVEPEKTPPSKDQEQKQPPR